MSELNRRQFLKHSIQGALVAGATSTAMAASDALTAGADLAERSREDLNAKLDELEQKFDKLEHHHKNLIRVGGIAFALSTGVDVLAFL